MFLGIIIVAKVLVIFFYVESDRIIFSLFLYFSIRKLSIVFGKDFLSEGAIWNLITTHTGITLEQCMQNQQENFGQETLIYKKSKGTAFTSLLFCSWIFRSLSHSIKQFAGNEYLCLRNKTHYYVNCSKNGRYIHILKS